MTPLFPIAGFGPNRLDPWPAAVSQVQAARRGELKARLARECPRRPGVYGMLDRQGQLIYVGKAKDLRKRLLSYFRPRRVDRRAARILGQTRAVLWEGAASEFAALLRELELIQQWRPQFNVQGRPGRHLRTYVCLGRPPAPYLYLSCRPRAVAFGPVLGRRRAAAVVRLLNDRFRLRDCPQPQPMVFAREGELFPVRAAGCIRYEIGTCLGPCAALCGRADYAKQVHAARRFLEGNKRGLFEVLEKEMAASAAALQFERAASLRDQLDSLRWLDRQLERVRQAREHNTFIYPVPGQAGRHVWYFVLRGKVVRAFAAPTDATGRRRLARLAAELFSKPTTADEPTPDDMDHVFLVASWFRTHPDERRRLLWPETILSPDRKRA
jgi:excinuclease ABC subunit C